MALGLRQGREQRTTSKPSMEGFRSGATRRERTLRRGSAGHCPPPPPRASPVTASGSCVPGALALGRPHTPALAPTLMTDGSSLSLPPDIPTV